MLEAPPDAPIREGGVTHIPVLHCPYCGSPEHSYYPGNQWQKRFKLQTHVDLKEGKVLVSTVNLMMEHPGGFFETMIFGETVNLTDLWLERYWTKDEAVKRHHEIVEKLKNGRYRLVPVEWRIELLEDEREMSEEIWVKCKICGKGFDSYEALIAHIYSHIDELKKKVKGQSLRKEKRKGNEAQG
jgi:hypothetical protein